jgi:hypothetical protein
MVQLNGGPETLGVNGLLGHLLLNLVRKTIGQVGVDWYVKPHTSAYAMHGQLLTVGHSIPT